MIFNKRATVSGIINRIFSRKPSFKNTEKEKIKGEIEALNPWFYPLEISGVKIIPGIYPSKDNQDLSTTALINRHRCRKTLLVDEVTKRFDFSGARILDVACNCSYWTSVYISKYGASSMVGIEGREQFIKQAKLYYQSLGILNKACFIHANIMEYDYDKFGRNEFDFVLCAGILYHIKDHGYLLEKISKVNKDILLIDTRVSEQGEEFEESNNLCFNAIEATRDKKVPRKEDLTNILRKLGYEVEIIPHSFKTVAGVDSNDDYNAGKRVSIFCRKKQ